MSKTHACQRDFLSRGRLDLIRPGFWYIIEFKMTFDKPRCPETAHAPRGFVQEPLKRSPDSLETR